MLTIYKTTDAVMEAVPQIVKGCWVHVINPTAEDRQHLANMGVPSGFLTHLGDPDERSRTERDDSGALLIILRFPYAVGAEADVPFITLPLSIIILNEVLVTVSVQTTGLLQHFTADNVRGLSTSKKTRFVLQLFLYIANEYLARVRDINAAVDLIEDRLQRSLRNQEVLELLRYQKSLVYFTTALKSNELVLRRLQGGKLLQLYSDDDDLLDDVLIEVQQALEMTAISENILSQMMDAFASIISNNLNVVMKVLASATIVLSVPSVIASIYGMNVSLPGSGHPLAFVGVIMASVLMSGLLAFSLWKRGWF